MKKDTTHDTRPVPLSDEDFLGSTVDVAKSLLGMRLSTLSRGKKTSGMIVEVEAYCGDIDAASHAAMGRTPRNEVMFRSGGHCYVYISYGIHHCVNVVTEREGQGTAVLIRAIEPLEGIDVMRKRRQGARRKHPVSVRELTNGPGKLCQAMGIDMTVLGHHLLRSPAISLTRYRTFRNDQIVASRRVGISKAVEFEWRFFVKGNEWVSR